MTNVDSYMIAITALLPLMAVLLVLQVNPYQALVIRGILGAIAALVYALYGAADVALTEALVGTMLSITLYAVAVRSSMIVRIGVIENALLDNTVDKVKGAAVAGESVEMDAVESAAAESAPIDRSLVTQVSALERAFSEYCVRVEYQSYADQAALSNALCEKEIHVACESSNLLSVRVQRLYDILQANSLLLPDTKLTYVDVGKDGQVSAGQIGDERLTFPQAKS
ncbi:MAG: hydrogenase subunit MbhD domain-containing protein [Cyanobacteria bacterium J06621_11]